jgi:thioesterase domain-containing protein
MPVSSLFNLTDRLGKEHPLFGLKVAGYFTWKYFRRNSQHIVHSIQKQLGGRSKTSYAAAYSAFNNYKPKPYPGRVVLFKASHREWEEENYLMEAWKKFIIGDLEVRIIPGDHLNLIKDPSAIELASQLKEILRNSGIRP